MEEKISYFLGANTPSGFYSLYEPFHTGEGLRRCWLLKGGPGCGKSTLMKRAAARLEEAGQPVEYIACSADPDSLDGIYAPRLDAAILDATAPHALEAAVPGAVDRYADLGRFYNCRALEPLAEDIRAAYGYRKHYARVDRCLTGAVRLMEDDRALLYTPELERKARKRAAGILSRECGKKTGREGRMVRRFLSGVTGQGLLCRFSTVTAQCRRIYELSDSWGLAEPLLRTLAEGFCGGGCRVVCCLSPLEPDRLEHVLVPELSLAFVSTGPFAPCPFRPDRRIRVDAMAEDALLRDNRPRLRFARRVEEALLAEAVSALARAKADHDRLEAIYHPYVDFDGVLREADRIAEAMLEQR